MIQYRLYKQTDFPDVARYCKEHNFQPLILMNPRASVMIAINTETNEVVGLAGIKVEAFFEPLISDNPLVALGLQQRIEGLAIGSKYENLRCVCNKERQKLFEKAGYELLEDNKIIMEKNLI